VPANFKDNLYYSYIRYRCPGTVLPAGRICGILVGGEGLEYQFL